MEKKSKKGKTKKNNSNNEIDLKEFKKQYNKVYQFIAEEIICNPIYHPIAMDNSIKYQEFFNQIDDSAKEKFKKARDIYYISRGHFYILLFASYFCTYGIAFVIRWFYMKNKKKKFIEYLQTEEFENTIDFLMLK